jgi:L,D-transpeptidase ErfK/SrfK
MGLSVGSLGIHGTNSPGSVYRAVTHGCIRLRPDDIAALFVKVQLGTTGTVVYEPVLVAVDGYDVFMEAHPDIYHRGPADALAFARDRARALGVFDSVDWNVAGQVIGARAGAARVVTR